MVENSLILFNLFCGDAVVPTGVQHFVEEFWSPEASSGQWNIYLLAPEKTPTSPVGLLQQL